MAFAKKTLDSRLRGNDGVKIVVPLPIQAFGAGFSGDPVAFAKRHWIPAFAGMTA
jgi:hypothetical protein